MSLIVHHLRRSQSERIVWLCEELGISYELKGYNRVPPRLLAPDEYRHIHWTGTAPVIQDGSITLAESGAVVEYILTKYGQGRLVLGPSHPNYADYLFWLHHANGSIQPEINSIMFAKLAGLPETSPVSALMQQRFNLTLKAMNEHLSKFNYLGGNDLTAADIMTVFSLSTMRLFAPISLTEYPHIVAYLQRIGQREAYRRAMEKGDPGLEPVLSGQPPERSLLSGSK